MNQFENVKIKVKNFKCFGEEESGCDCIKPINIIIGRNNTGKSTLLDLIGYVCDPQSIMDIKKYGNNGKEPQVMFYDKLTDGDISFVFKKGVSGGPFGGAGDHYEYGKKYIGSEISWEIIKDTKNKISYELINCTNDDFNERTNAGELIPFDLSKTNYPPEIMEYFKSLGSNKENPFKNKIFLKLNAERNIKPEGMGGISVIEVQSDGTGATRIVEDFKNNEDHNDLDLIDKIHSIFNSIFSPEGEIDSIEVKRDKKGEYWEISLKENTKGIINLTDSGSGIKTILLVLINLLLVPKSQTYKSIENHRFIFAFEELENNLHPAMQRKLMLFIRDFVEENKCTVFITTHSNVVIDLFSKDENAQIIHVQQENGISYTKPVIDYHTQKGILDDLDFRASDLLQSNCVIWVEGPSDKIYIDKWIEIVSGGKIIEGIHYQCVFYCGRLLSHITADEENEDIDDLIKILMVNKNSIIVIDSDIKKMGSDDLNSTKRRVIKEFEENDLIAWVTYGREIENYLSSDFFMDYYNLEKRIKFSKIGKIDNYLKYVKEGEGKRYIDHKVDYAKKYVKIFKSEYLDINDLKDKLKSICDQIKIWNKID